MLSTVWIKDVINLYLFRCDIILFRILIIFDGCSIFIFLLKGVDFFSPSRGSIIQTKHCKEADSKYVIYNKTKAIRVN